MKAVFEQYLQPGEEEEQEEPSQPTRRKLPNGNVEEIDDYRASLTIDDSYLTGELHKQKKACLQSELDQYYLGDRPSLSSVKDPLEWWHTEDKKQYPTLYRIALDFLSIPATSCECERVFSQAKKLITDERNCLKADSIEACELQKNWLLNEAVTSPLLDLIARLERRKIKSVDTKDDK